MLLFGAILLAIFVLPSPWGLVAVIAGGVIDITESVALLKWSKRRRSPVGAEALVGQRALVISPTQVRVAGEIWGARANRSLVPGDDVTVRSFDGLTLVVE